MGCLSDPSLTPTFAEEILYTFCRHSSQHDTALPIAYYSCGLVSFQSSKVLEAFFTILCRASITEAFFFSRARGERAHQNLFEKLIEFVLLDSQGAVRELRSLELVSLPLNDREASWFEDFLQTGRVSRLPGASDTIILRGLATGRQDIISSQDRHRNNHKIAGLDWTILDNSIKRITQKRAESLKWT